MGAATFSTKLLYNIRIVVLKKGPLLLLTMPKVVNKLAFTRAERGAFLAFGSHFHIVATGIRKG